MLEIKFVVDNALLWSFPWHSLRTGSLSFCLCMPVEDTLCSLDRVSEVTLNSRRVPFCHCVYKPYKDQELDLALDVALSRALPSPASLRL